MSSPSDGAATTPHVPSDAAALLERAVGYTRGVLTLVPGADLAAPTPCRRWDLASLLRHLEDSLAALTDAATVGRVDLRPLRGADLDAGHAPPAVDRLRSRACALLGAWAHHPGPRPVGILDRDVDSDLLAAAGALEVAVHGWDVARGCGVDRPLPTALALDLLAVLPLLVTDADRPGRFAAPVDVPPHAPPSTRLLAALGRRA